MKDGLSTLDCLMTGAPPHLGIQSPSGGLLRPMSGGQISAIA